MGSQQSAKIVEVIHSPDKEKLKVIFMKFDKDGSGGLSLDEWKLFGKYLWLADVKGARDDVANEVREEFKRKAPNMAGMVGSMAATGVNLLNSDLQPKDVDQWVEDLFKRADKNSDGKLTFDEFAAFLEQENPALAEEHRAKLREAVASNMDAHGGTLAVTSKHGAVTKSVTVTAPGASSEVIRGKKPDQ